jgi:hypothetical protein
VRSPPENFPNIFSNYAGFYLVYPHPKAVNSIILSKKNMDKLESGKMVDDTIVKPLTIYGAANILGRPPCS